MRNAKSAALLALFANAERRNVEAQSVSAMLPPSVEKLARPIQLDLATLARRKSRA